MAVYAVPAEISTSSRLRGSWRQFAIAGVGGCRGREHSIPPRVFRHMDRRNPACEHPGTHGSAKTLGWEAGQHTADAGPSLVVASLQAHVFRPAVLWIVLTLALGPSASVLCQSFCDSHASAAGDCHHEGPSPVSLGDGDHCDTVGLDAAYLREDASLRVSAPDRHQAMPVLVYQTPKSSTSPALVRARLESAPSDRRPLLIALRI